MKSLQIELEYLALYPGCDDALKALKKMIEGYKKCRPKLLKNMDSEGAEWVKSPGTVGMMLYVDLFNGTFDGLVDKLKYFKDLGVTLIHLMPLLAPRLGENDGGYAVRDYRQVDPRLGDLEAFKRLLLKGKEMGLRFCIDYVVNHTADDHPWALAAKAGDSKYRAYYHVIEDISVVEAYESNLPQVFPKVAPGNFTYNTQLEAHVMTTFYPYQWDLNFSNTDVFHEMVENLLFFANMGVDMVRLDAIPYIWKRLGTNSRNLPEVHWILRLFREILEWVAPSSALLGEVIMAPNLIAPYFGTESEPECQVLYHAGNMVALWNSIATRDARHLEYAHFSSADISGIWMHYARCHDDIGWGLNEDHLKEIGFDPKMHKQFLIDFYYGILSDSFSVGELYEYEPISGDARNSGTLASLAGLERALNASDSYQVELAIKRIWLIHALLLMRPGIPMLYSGDEWAQLNHWEYVKDSVKAHDSRWLHRVPFNWDVVEQITSSCVVEKEGSVSSMSPFKWTYDNAASLVYKGVKELIKLRREYFTGESLQKELVLYQGNPAIFVLAIDTDWLMIFNLSEHAQWLYQSPLKRHGIRGTFEEILQGKSVNFEGEKRLLGPLEINILRKVQKTS